MMSSKNQDNVDRGEAAEQEQERIIGEVERDATKKSEKRAPQNRGEVAEQEQERIIGEAER